jgi:hypothetical protein
LHWRGNEFKVGEICLGWEVDCIGHTRGSLKEGLA